MVYKLRICSSKKERNASTIISRQKWNKLSKVLSSAKDESYEIPRSNQCGNSSGLLNVACRYNPPLHIIEELSSLEDNAFFMKNSLGQFPLHVAAKYGASTDVMSYILKQNPDAVVAQDVSGKTPLHLLFHDYTRKRKIYGGDFRQSMISIIDMFCINRPRVVMIEDSETMCPIESAIAEEFDLKIIRRVQKISREFHELSKICTNMLKEKPTPEMLLKDKLLSERSVSREVVCRRGSVRSGSATVKRQFSSPVA